MTTLISQRPATTSAALTWQIIDTPDGPFAVVETAEGGVIAAGWTGDVDALLTRSKLREWSVAEGPVTVAAAVDAYYAGDLDAPLRVPVHDLATGFGARVRAALRDIRAGEVRCYGDVATALGNPRASRAVGAACGANSVALFVPCHRVIGASGALTGFAWGVEVKRSLLEREGALA